MTLDPSLRASVSSGPGVWVPGAAARRAPPRQPPRLPARSQESRCQCPISLPEAAAAGSTSSPGRADPGARPPPCGPAPPAAPPPDPPGAPRAGPPRGWLGPQGWRAAMLQLRFLGGSLQGAARRAPLRGFPAWKSGPPSPSPPPPGLPLSLCCRPGFVLPRTEVRGGAPQSSRCLVRWFELKIHQERADACPARVRETLLHALGFAPTWDIKLPVLSCSSEQHGVEGPCSR